MKGQILIGFGNGWKEGGLARENLWKRTAFLRFTAIFPFYKMLTNSGSFFQIY